jgi:hypothetical protein
VRVGEEVDLYRRRADGRPREDVLGGWGRRRLRGRGMWRRGSGRRRLRLLGRARGRRARRLGLRRRGGRRRRRGRGARRWGCSRGAVDHPCARRLRRRRRRGRWHGRERAVSGGRGRRSLRDDGGRGDRRWCRGWRRYCGGRRGRGWRCCSGGRGCRGCRRTGSRLWRWWWRDGDGRRCRGRRCDGDRRWGRRRRLDLRLDGRRGWVRGCGSGGVGRRTRRPTEPERRREPGAEREHDADRDQRPPETARACAGGPPAGCLVVLELSERVEDRAHEVAPSVGRG